MEPRPAPCSRRCRRAPAPCQPPIHIPPPPPLAARVALGGVLSIGEAMRQIAHNINFIVHVTLRDDTWRGGLRRRFVSEVRQLTGVIENERPTTHLVYRSDPTPLFQPEAMMSAELSAFREASWER